MPLKRDCIISKLPLKSFKKIWLVECNFKFFFEAKLTEEASGLIPYSIGFFNYLKVLSFRLMHLLGFTRVGRLNALFVGCWRKMFSILTLIFRKLSSFLRSALLSRLGYILQTTPQISSKNQQILDLICDVPKWPPKNA